MVDKRKEKGTLQGKECDNAVISIYTNGRHMGNIIAAAHGECNLIISLKLYRMYYIRNNMNRYDPYKRD